MFAFRASKFRNLEGKPAAREASYDQLQVTAAAVEGSAVAAAPDRWAFAHQIDGGAAIQVKALSDTGKETAAIPPLLRGHQARVNALEFSPFHQNVLLSGSADTTVKVWKLPDDAADSELPSASTATLASSGSSIVSVRHHPSAAEIAVAVSHRDVLVFDLGAEALAYHVEPLGLEEDTVSSVTWNYDGSQLVTSTLNQQVRLLDPRSAGGAVVAEFKAHTGKRRPTSVAWCGRLDLLVTTGCDAMQERELKLWDPRNTAKPLARERLDASIGQLFPLYDVDTDLLYVLGKGDRSVRAFEVDASGIHKLSQTLLPHMTLGAALVPKRACDTQACEVARVLNLSANGGGSNGVCDVLSFTVPRKNARSEFQRDLYPDTAARTPALSAAEWTSGQNAVPVLERVTPTETVAVTSTTTNGGHGSVFGVHTSWNAGPSAPTPPSGPPPPTQPAGSMVHATTLNSNGWGDAAASPWASTTSNAWNTTAAAASPSPDKPTVSSSSGWASKTTAWNAAPSVTAPSAGAATVARPVQWFTPEPAATAAVGREEAASANAPAETVVPEKIARFTTSQGHKLKYIKGKQSTRNDTLSLGDKAAASSCIRANATYMAIPLQGAGGPVLVSPLTATGRVGADAIVLDSHKATVTDVAFHAFDDNLLATGSGDSTVAVWKVNHDDDTTTNAPRAVLRGHTKSVRSLEFHPRVADVLCSTAQDLSIRLWDVEVGEERVCLQGKLEDFVWNTAFSPDGSLLATSSRERLVRVFDPRAAHATHALVAMGCGFDSMRPQFVSWLSPSHLVTLGTTGSPRHETQLRIWDARSLVDPVSTATIDAAAAESVPFYDASSHVLFLASTGGRHIWSYEINKDDQSVHANLPFVADGLQPISAATLLPKRLCDVRAAEIDRLLLLRGNSVEQVSFTLPRNDKLREYFQDDVFGDVPRAAPSLMASEWFAGEQVVVEYESLCPEGMTPLSEKPEERNKPVPMSQQFRAKWEAEEREKKLKAENLERLQNLAAQPSLHGHGQRPVTVRQSDDSDDDWDD